MIGMDLSAGRRGEVVPTERWAALVTTLPTSFVITQS
jgi:hypothetical protein